MGRGVIQPAARELFGKFNSSIVWYSYTIGKRLD